MAFLNLLFLLSINAKSALLFKYLLYGYLNE